MIEKGKKLMVAEVTEDGLEDGRHCVSLCCYIEKLGCQDLVVELLYTGFMDLFLFIQEALIQLLQDASTYFDESIENLRLGDRCDLCGRTEEDGTKIISAKGYSICIACLAENLRPPKGIKQRWMC